MPNKFFAEAFSNYIKIFETYFDSIIGTPVSIYGATPDLSQKAIATFASTQKSHKQLYENITNAKDFRQAIKFREEARLENPLVGTRNDLYRKGDLVDTSGVLIEKRIRETEKIISDLLGLSRTRPAEKQKVIVKELVKGGADLTGKVHK